MILGLCPNCVHGTCNPINSKCTCDPQWRGTNCDLDVDECDIHTANCDPIAQCINQSPGYICGEYILRDYFLIKKQIKLTHISQNVLLVTIRPMVVSHAMVTLIRKKKLFIDFDRVRY